MGQGRLLGGLLACSFAVTACSGGSEPSPGELGGECFPNHTCYFEDGLVCDVASNECIHIDPPPDAAPAGDSPATIPDAAIQDPDAAPGTPDAPPGTPDAAPSPDGGPIGDITAGVYNTDPGFFDVELDTERHQVFLSYGFDGVVNVVDLHDGAETVVTTGYGSEFLHFDSIRDEVAVSLPTMAHSSFWWDEDQEGYVAVIDADTLADPTPIWIPLDPYQIVSDGTGYVYAGGGSGQWTSAIAVDLSTGWSTLSGGIVLQLTKIQIHPDLDRIYGADNGLSPSDIERWNLSAGTVIPTYDSPYHGTYPMCGDLRIHPGGDAIYTRCGHIFLASNVMTTDMTWIADMGLTWIDLDFHPDGLQVFVLVSGSPILYVYDAATLAPLTTVSLGSEARRILAGPTYIVVVRDILGGLPKTEIEVIPYSAL